VESLQGSIVHGQSAEWAVSAWAVNGDISDASIRLATGSRSLTAKFSFGCGSFDGTSSCDLRGVFAGSASRQVIASVAVPANATTVTSVTLTATESAADLTADPRASVSVPVKNGTGTGTNTSTGTGTGTNTGTGTGTGTAGDGSTVSQLPVGSLPTIGGNGSTSSISPGGNAAGLFPTINPSQDPSPAPGQDEAARQVADAEALPIGTPVIDGQLLGLGALAIAFLLAVTRLSVRRRPAAATAGGRGAAGAARTARASAVTRVEPAPAEAATADDSTRDDLTLDDTSADMPAADGEAPAGEVADEAAAASTRDDIKIIGADPVAEAAPWETNNEE
jgi:hypothetical protein